MPDKRAAMNTDASGRSGEDALVLVVEDNEKNARMIVAMLESAGYQTRWAADGEQGLTMTRRLQPAVVVTDLQMPGLDGLSMTRRLKAQDDTAGIPIIAVTAHAMAEHCEASLAAGCSKFLTKPIRYQTLLSEVSDVIKPTTA